MVSIILQQKKDRIEKVNAVVKALKKHPEGDIKNLVFELCNLFVCSERKAKEYIKIAKWKIEAEKDDKAV